MILKSCNISNILKWVQNLITAIKMNMEKMQKRMFTLLKVIISKWKKKKKKQNFKYSWTGLSILPLQSLIKDKKSYRHITLKYQSLYDHWIKKRSKWPVQYIKCNSYSSCMHLILYKFSYFDNWGLCISSITRKEIYTAPFLFFFFTNHYDEILIDMWQDTKNIEVS